MARQQEDVDWYVDMSERLERREQRRRWVVLGVCVAVPLGLMGLFLAYIALERSGVLARVRGAVRSVMPEKVEPDEPMVKELPLGPASVAVFVKGDIRFPQLDSDGLVTSVNHFFREAKPEGASVFTVSRDTEAHGIIMTYRLINLATGESHEFADVEVKKIDGEWTISEGGWDKVRTELQARMKVRLGKPTL